MKLKTLINEARVFEMFRGSFIRENDNFIIFGAAPTGINAKRTLEEIGKLYYFFLIMTLKRMVL